MQTISRNFLMSTAGIALSPLFAISAASAQSYGSFGDNIADPGNIPGILAESNQQNGTNFDTNFPASPPNAGNRYSNGPVAAELLPNLLDQSFSTIENRAVGNAFSGQLPVDLAGGILLGSGSAIPGPIGRGLTPLSPLDIGAQVDGFIAANGPLGQQDVALLYPSGNDGALALNTIALTMPSQQQALQITVAGAQVNAANTAASAGRLLDAGAGTVIVSNLPNIGLTPAARAGGLSGQQLATLFSTTTNDALVAGLSALDAGDNNLIVADTFTLNNDIVANPAKYGFADVTNPCSLVPSCVNADRSVQDQFLFWDAFFPTARGHEISAAFLADTVNAPRTVPAILEQSKFATEAHAIGLLDRGPGISGMWIDSQLGYGRYRRSSAPFAAGYEADGPVVDVALGWTGDNGLTLGVGAAYSDFDVDFRNLAASFDRRSVNLAAFAQYRNPIADVAVTFSYGFDEFENLRRATGVAGQIASAETEGESLSVVGEISREYWVSDTFALTPKGRIGYSRADFDGFSESGATGLDQIVSGGELESTFAEAGLEARFDNGVISAGVGGFYHFNLDDNVQTVQTSLVTLPTFVRSVTVAAPDDDYARADATLAIRLTAGLTLGVTGEATFAEDNFSYLAGRGFLRFRF